MSVLEVTHSINCGGRFHIPKELKKFTCPACSKKITQSNLTEVEETTLSPLSPSVAPFSLVVKPTFTTWEKSNRNSFLHIGISDSEGKYVYHFLKDGAHKDIWKNQNFICIPLSPPNNSALFWDEALTAHYSSELSRQKRTPYHTLDNNCYNFTVRFLNSINYDSSSSHTKDEIVQKWISVPVGATELYVEWLSRAKAGKLEPYPSFENCGGDGWACDTCGGLYGKKEARFRCQICPDYDLCHQCFEGNSHEHTKFDVLIEV